MVRKSELPKLVNRNCSDVNIKNTVNDKEFDDILKNKPKFLIWILQFVINLTLIMSLSITVFMIISFFYIEKKEKGTTNTTIIYDLSPPCILLWNNSALYESDNVETDTVDPIYFRYTLFCALFNCDLTTNQAYKSDITKYRAIIFDDNTDINKNLPRKRGKRQLYIFATQNPPTEMQLENIYQGTNTFYNMTMTYRLDSDIIWYPQIVFLKDSSMMVAPKENPIWETQPPFYIEDRITNDWEGKFKMGLSFPSTCKTQSKREKLITKLQNFIDIDIYGKCGHLGNQYDALQRNWLVNKKYKFYFAFESSLCIDYVSEDFYYAWKRNIIPVVYGGANYSRFAPPHSYINVEDFKNVESLANYLKDLASNQTAYMQYFWWREYYDCIKPSPLCIVCDEINNPPYFFKSRSYENITQWWFDNSCRNPATIMF